MVETYYCTKWATTVGIVKFEGRVADTRREDGPIYITSVEGSERRIFERLGTNVFATLEAAKKDAVKKAEKNYFSKQKAVRKARKIHEDLKAGKFKVTE